MATAAPASHRADGGSGQRSRASSVTLTASTASSPDVSPRSSSSAEHGRGRDGLESSAEGDGRSSTAPRRHAYPPTLANPRGAQRGVGDGGGGTGRRDGQHGRAAGDRDADEMDEDDAYMPSFGGEDEEERVGLMSGGRQSGKEKDPAAPSAIDGDADSTPALATARSRRRARTSRLRGCIALCVVTLLLLLLVPLLHWLSSSRPPSTAFLRNSVLTVDVPSYWSQPSHGYATSSSSSSSPAMQAEPAVDRPRPHGVAQDKWSSSPVSASQKPHRNKFLASSDDARGLWGLRNAVASAVLGSSKAEPPKKGGAGLAFDFVVRGWSSRVEMAHVGSGRGGGISAGGNAAAVAAGDRGAKGSGGTLLDAMSKPDALRVPSLDEIFNGTFSHRGSQLAWCKEDPDVGVFSSHDWGTGDIVLQDVTSLRKERTGEGEVAKGGGKVLWIKGDDVRDSTGRRIRFGNFKPSPDLRYALLFSDTTKQWRYSSFSRVWIHDVAAKRTYPLGIPRDAATSSKDKGDVAVAEWAPKPNATDANAERKMPPVAFVQRNNLYVQFAPDGKPVAVTSDGARDVFNGVPDWVYEEEVYAGDQTFWWSPDGTHIAFLRLDETKVSTYGVPIYNPSNVPGKTEPYLQSLDIKYPKPGFANPTVSVHVVDVTKLASGSSPDEARQELRSPSADLAEMGQEHIDLAIERSGGERLVTEVAWIDASNVLIKETDRASDAARIVNFKVARPGSQRRQLMGRVARRWSDKDEAGWIAAAQNVWPLARDLRGAPPGISAYLDLVIDAEGFRHIAYFANALEAKPLHLTRGRWEVERLSHVDVANRKVYFIAAKPHHTQRNLFVVELPDASNVGAYQPAEPLALTDTSQPATYSASFDPKGAYYLLEYKGPDVPWTKVVGTEDVIGHSRSNSNGRFELVLEDNAALRRTLSNYMRPTSVYYNVTTADGVQVSVHEMRPPDFDASGETRYPVLVHVYGGPDSQVVNAEFWLSQWHHYLVSSLGYVVARIDGRGTGWKGQAYRASVARRLGEDEATDVVGAAAMLQRLAYVDEDRVGVWGWSYGGYLTSKVVERDSGVFSLGMAVAPVSDWRFYDTIYTERYMKLLGDNLQGYANSSVHITPGFTHASYLLAQGTGDTNVHFESSAHLLDQLEAAHVRRFAFRMFPDSDHGIDTRGQYRELHEFLTQHLVGVWGPGGKRRFRSVHATRR